MDKMEKGAEQENDYPIIMVGFFGNWNALNHQKG